MKVFYTAEERHLKEHADSIFKTIRCDSGKEYAETVDEGRIVIVLGGQFRVTYGRFFNKQVKRGQMILLPPGVSYCAKIEKKLYLLAVRVRLQEDFTGSLSIYQGQETGPRRNLDLDILEIDKRMLGYIQCLLQYLADDIGSQQFYALKVRELLFLLKSYYPRPLLSAFFHPLIDRHSVFSDFVYANYDRYRSVKELAEASGHSLSVFHKLFRKNFGISPYQWIKTRKAENILFELIQTNIPVKEVSANYGFRTLPQFCNFCKKHLGEAPGKIRKNAIHSHSGRVVE